MLVVPNQLLDSINYILKTYPEGFDLFKYLIEKWFDIDSNLQFVDSEVSEKLKLDKESVKKILIKLSQLLPFLKIQKYKDDFLIIHFENKNTKVIIRNSSGTIFAIKKIYDIIKDINKELNLNINNISINCKRDRGFLRGKGEIQTRIKEHFTKVTLQKLRKLIHKSDSNFPNAELVITTQLDKPNIEEVKTEVTNIANLYKKFEGVEEQFIPLTQSENVEEKIPIKKSTWRSKAVAIWNLTDFVVYFRDMHSIMIGEKYIPPYSKDTNMIKILLQELTKNELKKCIDWYLANYKSLRYHKGKPCISYMYTNINDVFSGPIDKKKKLGEFNQSSVKSEQGILSSWE